MSEARDELAAAASTVEGVNVTPGYRQVMDAGEGMVRWASTAYPNRFGGVVTWQVLVMLPTDYADAEGKLETWLPALEQALAPVMAVQSARPQSVILDAGTVPALVLEGIRESE